MGVARLVLCRVYVYYQGVRGLLLVGSITLQEIHIISPLKGIVKVFSIKVVISIK
jgi:hypothetical protein